MQNREYTEKLTIDLVNVRKYVLKTIQETDDVERLGQLPGRLYCRSSVP